MAHHAYSFAGDRDAGIEAARAFGARVLDLDRPDHPDLAVLEYGLFSVDDAREVARFAAQAPVAGSARLVVIAVGRIFHEAQNALLKLFEEPQPGVTLVLVVPAEGLLLPTLRSRLQPLPQEVVGPEAQPLTAPSAADAFLAAGSAEREKLVTKLLARAKSDKDAEKQAARLEAVSLMDGITRVLYARHRAGEPGMAQTLGELSRFAALMHDRSAPLKMVFEHLLLVLPSGKGAK